MAKDYTYDKNTKTYTFKNGDVSIHHISEKMFDMEQWKALMWIPWPETRKEDK